MQAINSLRMETGYRHWESDITPDETPYEAGLGFGVKLEKGDFIGRSALLDQKKDGLRQKLLMFTLNDPQPVLYNSEAIWRNGKWVGEISSGAYGHFLGCAVGMGYLEKPDGTVIDNKWISAGNYEIEIEGKKIPAEVHIKSPYDPHNERVKM